MDWILKRWRGLNKGVFRGGADAKRVEQECGVQREGKRLNASKERRPESRLGGEMKQVEEGHKKVRRKTDECQSRACQARLKTIGSDLLF